MWYTRKRTKAASLALDGAMLVLALALSYVEEVILPLRMLPVPGFKLGLANLVVMTVFVYIGIADAAVISLLRVTITAVLFGTPITFWFSFAGAVCALLLLFLLYRLHFCRLSWTGVSILCAAAHNFGQAFAAMIFFGVAAIVSYLPWLVLMAVAGGAVTGAVMCILCRRLFPLRDKSNR